MSFQALSARLADPAPAFLCEGLVDGSEILVRVEHLVGAPTTTSELDTFRRLLRGVAPDLLEVWARWNGVRLYAEPDVAEPNHLVALHPVDEMEDWTLAMREWLDIDDPEDAPDRAALETALVIGAPAMSLSCLVVLTEGPRAGRICVFDHETRCAEDFAATATELLERLAGDPLELIEPLGDTTRYRWDEGQSFPVSYLPDLARAR